MSIDRDFDTRTPDKTGVDVNTHPFQNRSKEPGTQESIVTESFFHRNRKKLAAFALTAVTLAGVGGWAASRDGEDRIAATSSVGTDAINDGAIDNPDISPANQDNNNPEPTSPDTFVFPTMQDVNGPDSSLFGIQEQSHESLVGISTGEILFGNEQDTPREAFHKVITAVGQYVNIDSRTGDPAERVELRTKILDTLLLNNDHSTAGFVSVLERMAQAQDFQVDTYRELGQEAVERITLEIAGELTSFNRGDATQSVVAEGILDQKNFNGATRVVDANFELAAGHYDASSNPDVMKIVGLPHQKITDNSGTSRVKLVLVPVEGNPGQSMWRVAHGEAALAERALLQ